METPRPWRIGDAGHTIFGPKTSAPSPKTVARDLSKEDARIILAAVNTAEERRLLAESIRRFREDCLRGEDCERGEHWTLLDRAEKLLKEEVA